MHSVTSSFIYEAAQKNALWQRKLMIGSSDYSAYVMQWPSISRAWDDCAPGLVTIDLTNAGQTFNFFLADGTKLHADCSLQLGLNGEYISLLSGTIDALRFRDAKVSMTLVDKFKKLSDRRIGDLTTPKDYTSSDYLAHDLAWYLCTSHGGLSAITSTSNPDLDYASFGSWTAAFSADNIRMKAQFTGQTASEMLRKVAFLTQSAIWIENNKLKFVRFSIADSSAMSFDDTTVLDGEMTMDERDLVNKIYVGANYNVTSLSYPITVNDSSSSSISRYGYKERIINETFVWLADSNSALNFAQRMVLSGRELLPQVSIDAPLRGVHITIGDTIAVADPQLGIAATTYRIMQETTNMDNGRKSYVVDGSQYFPGFTLDVSTLDSLAVLL